MIEDVFSLCFGSVEGDGALLLGEVDLSAYNVELEYTPLLTSAQYPHYYSVKLMGIQVGNTKLNVPTVRTCLQTFQAHSFRSALLYSFVWLGVLYCIFWSVGYSQDSASDCQT